MADLTKLTILSVDQLRAELDARKAQTESRLALPPGESLDEFDDATIVDVLREKQKVIYGTDDRGDIFQPTEPASLADAESGVPGLLLKTETVLHETGDDFDFGLDWFDGLFAIKKQGGATNSTEVHVLDSGSGYQRFTFHAGTPLPPTDNSWAFAVAPQGDLFAIRKKGGQYNLTELHVLSAAANFQQFIRREITALHATDGTWAFAVDHAGDLYAIKKQGGGTNSTEVHILSAASNYQQFRLHTKTALHPTDDNWAFALAPINLNTTPPAISHLDLFAINKQGATTSTEVHVLSARSNYQDFVLHTSTALPPTSTDWAFAVTSNRDLFAIKKRGTGTNSTEIYIIDLP